MYVFGVVLSRGWVVFVLFLVFYVEMFLCKWMLKGELFSGDFYEIEDRF